MLFYCPPLYNIRSCEWGYVMVTDKDREIIRSLARKWMELASMPVMNERKKLWGAVNDLHQIRPVILIETSPIEGFVEETELQCENKYLRAVERNMLDNVRHAEEVGDDIVLEPYYRIGWQIDFSSFGVDVETKPAVTSGGSSLGYSFNFPIQGPEDLNKLAPRNISVDRETSLANKTMLEECMGDILPVRIGNYDPFLVNPGNEEWAGLFFHGLTWQIYRFIGNDNLLYWVYDQPETIHKLMRYMTDERRRTYEYIQKESLLVPNTDNQMAGPRHYGYVSELPAADDEQNVQLKDLWCWPESQEANIISPEMYNEFVLPYLAELSNMFGLSYYGCCEPVHDRLESIKKAIPNLRAVSVSGWSDFRKVAEMLGKEYVYSRKPTPAYLSGANPDWDLVEKDMKKTFEVTRDSNLQLLFRDLYTIDGDRPRLRKWVDLAKGIFGI
jgi:hypothetical protein